jgi:hypothetical protein
MDFRTGKTVWEKLAGAGHERYLRPSFVSNFITTFKSKQGDNKKIEILNQSTDKTLVVHISGEISGEEYQGFVKALDECFVKGDEVNLVLDLKGVEF